MSSKIILVNGLLPYDSGKTYLTIALAKALKNKGYNVLVYKPVAGHSAWYQFNTVINSLKYGILVGEDVVKYKELLGLKTRFELLNPIDLLLAPLNPRSFTNISEYLTLLSSQFSQIVLLRLSDCRDNTTQYYMVKDNIARTIPELKPWIERLIEKFNPKPISVECLLNILKSASISEILDYALNVLKREADIVIVESFNNAAVPYFNILDNINLVLTVTPGYLFKLDVNSFKEIVKAYGLKYGDTGLSMSAIFDRIRVVYDIAIPPVSSICELNLFIERILTRLLKE